MTALHWAVKSGHANVTNSILEANPFESNSQADDGRTALFFAARADQWDIAMLLLNAGADVNVERAGGWSVLHSAAGSGGESLPVVRTLVDAGADVNLQAQDGRAPLHFAAHRGNTEVVKLLIEAGAEVNVEMPGKETPLFFCAMKGHPETCRALLDGGADPTLLNAGLGNPLHQAAAWPGEGREAAHKGHAEAVSPNCPRRTEPLAVLGGYLSQLSRSSD